MTPSKPPKQVIQWPLIAAVCMLLALIAVMARCNAPAIPLKAPAVMGDPEAGKVYYRSFNTSAYCLCEKCCNKKPSHPAYGITASGHHVQPGDRLVAAPRTYPIGTVMEIPGYNDGWPVVVEDRGGAIKAGLKRTDGKPLSGIEGLDKLDLLFDTHKEAIQYGRKTVRVKIYVEPAHK
jgi:3D (Asp-Asp-Asp) domain-containing protein